MFPSNAIEIERFDKRQQKNMLISTLLLLLLFINVFRVHLLILFFFSLSQSISKTHKIQGTKNIGRNNNKKNELIDLIMPNMRNNCERMAHTNAQNAIRRLSTLNFFVLFSSVLFFVNSN